jgi:steroid 5-alpha reductase family enzyme
MTSTGDLLLVAAVTVLVLMILAWLLSLLVKDASIVDMIWGLGFVVVAWATYLQAAERGGRGLLLTVLVTVWGVRLSGYLIWRNLGKPEDFRYREMRARAPRWFWLVSLFQVFLLQGVLMWVISAPVVVAQLGGGDLYWLDYLGIALWAVGLFFESVGDIQLARFKSQPGSTGKVMDRGLWRYTRHPNYFGDFAVWWGHFLIAAAGGAWWTVFSPVVMSVLLLRVSGVAMLERTISKRRPEYEEYARRTNAFFPGPPKRF